MTDFSETVDQQIREGAVEAGKMHLGTYTKSIAKGTVIFDQDEDGETMFFVIEGRIRISKVVGKRVQPIAMIEAGDFFGEMALLSEDVRSARAEALTDCKLVELDNNTFREFLRSNHDASIRMLLTLVKRLRQTDELIEHLMFDDPQKKVASTLLRLIKDVPKDSGGYEVPADVHQLMIASGTDTKLLRMILKRFRDAGFLDIEDRTIMIKDLKRLEQYNNFLNMKGDYLAEG